MEDLPYLEILCMSGATSNTHQGLAPEGGVGEGEESPQSFEKQGSLITLAWSKPPEDDADYEAEAAAEGTGGRGRDDESSLKTQVQPSDVSSTAGETDGEELKPNLQRAICDQPEKGGAASECDLQTHALVAETQPHLLVDPPEVKPHAGDLCSGLTNETANVDRDVDEVEMCPAATESELWDAEDQKYNSQATVSLLLHICATGTHYLCWIFPHYLLICRFLL